MKLNKEVKMYPPVKKDEDTKPCDCGIGCVKIKNCFGFFYCRNCDRFFCAQCEAPLKPPNNGTADCTYCNNGIVTPSLVCPI